MVKGAASAHESSRNNSDSSAAATTTIVESASLRSINAAEAAESRMNESELFRLKKNLKALKEVGIYGIKAQEIAGLVGVLEEQEWSAGRSGVVIQAKDPLEEMGRGF